MWVTVFNISATFLHRRLLEKQSRVRKQVANSDFLLLEPMHDYAHLAFTAAASSCSALTKCFARLLVDGNKVCGEFDVEVAVDFGQDRNVNEAGVFSGVLEVDLEILSESLQVDRMTHAVFVAGERRQSLHFNLETISMFSWRGRDEEPTTPRQISCAVSPPS